MSAPTETELKLAVAPRDVRRLRARLAALVARAAPQRARLDNVYYDTADDLLARHRMALRVRRIGRRWVQTLKTGETNAALATRGEWEMPAPNGRLDLSRFAATPLAELL
ncbi:MAG TPA: CYTH domain-containing protein, partial [Burkholderiaceae bacterium]|nr:CYTH domain-containing protein [Burkholderiaceae bacterium]